MFSLNNILYILKAKKYKKYIGKPRLQNTNPKEKWFHTYMLEEKGT